MAVRWADQMEQMWDIRMAYLWAAQLAVRMVG
jgi:hypothetical protein